MTDTRIISNLVTMADEIPKTPLNNMDFDLSMLNLEKEYPHLDLRNSQHIHATAVLLADLTHRLRFLEEKFIHGK